MCRCGVKADSRGLHRLNCKFSDSHAMELLTKLSKEHYRQWDCRQYSNRQDSTVGTENDLMDLAQEERKIDKYSRLSARYIFIPIVIEACGFGPLGVELLSKIGGKLSAQTGHPRSWEFLLQRISIDLQRGNASCI